MDKDVDYVEVMFVKNLDEAKSCCNLLEDVGIIAQYDVDSGEPSDRGIAIKVPEERFIEASELLAARVQHDSVDDEDDERDERGKAIAKLGLADGADEKQIKEAYRRLAKQYHPDRVVGLGPEFAELAHKKFIEIKHAYELLLGKSGA